MSRKHLGVVFASLLIAGMFTVPAVADDSTPPSECGTGDTNNPCVGDGTSVEVATPGPSKCGSGPLNNPCAGDGTSPETDGKKRPSLPKTGVADLFPAVDIVVAWLT